MKVLFLNAGNETGGGMYHILRVLGTLHDKYPEQFILGVFEKKTLYERARNLGIRTVYFHNNSKFNPQLLKKMKQFIQKEQITHVHSHGPRANVYMNALKRFTNISWIITLHSNPLFDFAHQTVKAKFYTYLHTRSLKNADQIITVCDAFKPLLSELNIDSNRITTIRNGIDFSETHRGNITKEQLREKYRFSKDDFLIVKVARLEKVKDHHLAIETIKKLLDKENKNIHLLMIGDGSLKDRLQTTVRNLHIEKHVHFIGNVHNVQQYYSIADVVLLTSQSESFPYVLLEAAREKKPVIATNVGDVSKLITEPTYGWLIEPGDGEQLTRAIKEAVQFKEQGKLEEMGIKLYTHAKAHYTITHCVNQIYHVYQMFNR